MVCKNIISWLEEHGIQLDESYPAALNRMAKVYKKEKGLERLEDVYILIDTSKQEISCWKKHLCNTQSKKTIN